MVRIGLTDTHCFCFVSLYCSGYTQILWSLFFSTNQIFANVHVDNIIEWHYILQPSRFTCSTQEQNVHDTNHYHPDLTQSLIVLLLSRQTDDSDEQASRLKMRSSRGYRRVQTVRAEEAGPLGLTPHARPLLFISRFIICRVGVHFNTATNEARAQCNLPYKDSFILFNCAGA